MAKREIETIPYESIVDFKVSGAFYSRLQDLFFNLASQKSKEEYLTCIKNISAKNVSTNYEYDVQTLLILISEIESKAKEQGKMLMQEIEIPDENTDVSDK